MTRQIFKRYIASAVLLFAPSIYAEQKQSRHPDYRPLFSQEMLEQADPAGSARLRALEERNYQVWLEQQGESVPASAQASTADAADAVKGPSAAPARSAPARPAAVPGTGGSKLYRYTDAQGNVRFGDEYVAGAEEVQVSVAAPTARSRAEHEARLKEQAQMLESFEVRNESRQREAQARVRDAQERAEHEANCKALFLDIQDNRRGGFLSYDLDADGERVYISGEELAARTDRMEETYRENCGKLPPISR